MIITDTLSGHCRSREQFLEALNNGGRRFGGSRHERGQIGESMRQMLELDEIRAGDSTTMGVLATLLGLTRGELLDAMSPRGRLLASGLFTIDYRSDCQPLPEDSATVTDNKELDALTRSILAQFEEHSAEMMSVMTLIMTMTPITPDPALQAPRAERIRELRLQRWLVARNLARTDPSWVAKVSSSRTRSAVSATTPIE